MADDAVAVMPGDGAPAPAIRGLAPNPMSLAVPDSKSDVVTGDGPVTGAPVAHGANESMATRNDLSIVVSDGKVTVRDGDAGHAAEFPEHMEHRPSISQGPLVPNPANSAAKPLPRGAEVMVGTLLTFQDMVEACAPRIRLVQAASVGLLGITLALLVIAAISVANRTAYVFALAAWGLLVTGALGCIAAPAGAWGAGRIRIGYVDLYLLCGFAISAMAILFGITAFTTSDESLSDRAATEYDKNGDVQRDYATKTEYQDKAQSDLNRLKVIGILTIPVTVAVVVFALRLRTSVRRALTTMQHQTERVAASQQRRALREREIERWEAAQSSPQKTKKKSKKASRYAAEGGDDEGDASEPVDVEAGRRGGGGDGGAIDNDEAMTGAVQPQASPAPRRKRSDAAGSAKKKKTKKKSSADAAPAAADGTRSTRKKRAVPIGAHAVEGQPPAAAPAAAAAAAAASAEPTELAPLPRPSSS